MKYLSLLFLFLLSCQAPQVDKSDYIYVDIKGQKEPYRLYDTKTCIPKKLDNTGQETDHIDYQPNEVDSPSEWIQRIGKYLDLTKPVKYEYIGGTPEQISQKEACFDELRDSLPTLELVRIFDSDINTNTDAMRIGFVQGIGSWAYKGNDYLLIRWPRLTMNFGWPMDDCRVPMHEAGHQIFNMEHEHARMRNIDKKAAYAEYARCCGWSEQDVDRNFDLSHRYDYDSSEVIGSFDLMHYGIPCHITTDSIGCDQWNSEFSMSEWDRLRDMVPKPPEPPKKRCLIRIKQLEGIITSLEDDLFECQGKGNKSSVW